MAFTKRKCIDEVKFIAISGKDFLNVNWVYQVEESGGSMRHGEVLGFVPPLLPAAVQVPPLTMWLKDMVTKVHRTAPHRPP